MHVFPEIPIKSFVCYVDTDQDIGKGDFPAFGIISGRPIFYFSPGFVISKYHY